MNTHEFADKLSKQQFFNRFSKNLLVITVLFRENSLIKELMNKSKKIPSFLLKMKKAWLLSTDLSPYTVTRKASLILILLSFLDREESQELEISTEISVQDPITGIFLKLTSRLSVFQELSSNFSGKDKSPSSLTTNTTS